MPNWKNGILEYWKAGRLGANFMLDYAIELNFDSNENTTQQNLFIK
jgi:hypothetical protein